MRQGIIKTADPKLDLSMGDLLSFYETKAGNAAENIKKFTEILTDEFKQLLRDNFIPQDHYSEDDYLALNSLYENDQNILAYKSIETLLQESKPSLAAVRNILKTITEEISKITQPILDKANRSDAEQEQCDRLHRRYRSARLILAYDLLANSLLKDFRLLESSNKISTYVLKESTQDFDKQDFCKKLVGSALFLLSIAEKDRNSFINPVTIVNSLKQFYFENAENYFLENSSDDIYQKLFLKSLEEEPQLVDILQNIFAYSIIKNVNPSLLVNTAELPINPNLEEFCKKHELIEKILTSQGKTLDEKILEIISTDDEKIASLKLLISNKESFVKLETLISKLSSIQDFQEKYQIIQDWAKDRSFAGEKSTIEISQKFLTAFQNDAPKDQAEVIKFLFSVKQIDQLPTNSNHQEDNCRKLIKLVKALSTELSIEQVACFSKALIEKKFLANFCIEAFEHQNDRIDFLIECHDINYLSTRTDEGKPVIDILNSLDFPNRIVAFFKLQSAPPRISLQNRLIETIKHCIAPKVTELLEQQEKGFNLNDKCQDYLLDKHLKKPEAKPNYYLVTVNPETTLFEFLSYNFINDNKKFTTDRSGKYGFLSFFKPEVVDDVLKKLKAPIKILLKNFPSGSEFEEQKQNLQNFSTFIEEKINDRAVPREQPSQAGATKVDGKTAVVEL